MCARVLCYQQCRAGQPVCPLLTVRPGEVLRRLVVVRRRWRASVRILWPRLGTAPQRWQGDAPATAHRDALLFGPRPDVAAALSVQRSELAGWANYGYCAAHSRWYWGLMLYLLATAEGMPVAWCLADPKLGEREVAAELLAHARDLGALRDQRIVLADKDLAGREMERYAADQVKVLLARPNRKDERRRYGKPGRDAALDRSDLRISGMAPELRSPRSASTPRQPFSCRYTQ
jgi:hypothetical protein